MTAPNAPAADLPPDVAALHVLSNFTFLRGASHPEELVARAAELGYRAIAITDECSLAGIVRAHAAAREAGIRLVVGSEFTLEDGPKVVLLAPDRAAYAALASLISDARSATDKGEYRLTRADVECAAPRIARLYALWIADRHAPSAEDLCWLESVFGGMTRIGVGCFLDGTDEIHLAQMRRLSCEHGIPMVAADDVHMHVWSRRPLQDVVTAIRLRSTVAGATPARFANGERHLRPRSRLARLYPPEVLAETVRIAESCTFALTDLEYTYPREIVPEGTTPAAWLARLARDGMTRRYPEGVPDRVATLVERELELIAEMGYEAFFLTVHDIVRFAKSRGILCQGRGSAANSAVCYCLGITEVDPARMSMLFERFISKERNQPPDIDVDFEHQRREEVIQYVYRKYGRRRAALAATVITYRLRSAIRDVGKALGMSLEQVDRLAGNLYWWDRGQALPERLAEVGFDPQNPTLRRLVALVAELQGFPRHLSQHVGGFVMSDQPLTELVPIENASMPDRTVIQWDKDDLETLGLLKVDCLCLGMLSAIRRSFDLIREYDGRELTMAHVPPEDPATYRMIQHADTMGVFQIESRAQMAMLPRLKPATYYDLVIQIAIIRPGPIQGDMVHPYLRRRNGEEPVRYPSDEVRDILARTLGVPLFQEQVIKLAMVAAGFSGGEADQLRRSMATFKRTGGVGGFRDRLIEGMRARGYRAEFAEQIFSQIQGFGEYGFPESHSASFALLAYVSAWLKCHEPAAFAGALINAQPMGFYAPAQLVADARRHGVEVRPVDVRFSGYDCTLEPTDPGAPRRLEARHPVGRDPRVPPPALRLGLRLVRGMREQTAERIVAVRREAPFESVQDLAARAALDRHDLKVLAGADALSGLSGDRHRAGWEALGVEAATPVFQTPRFSEATPMLSRPTEGDDIVADYAATGLSLRRHPLALLRGRLVREGFVCARDLRTLPHGTRVRAGGLVINRQRPGTATGIVFATLEDETGYVNLVVWSSLVERQRRPLLGARLLGVDGEVQREGEVVHLIAETLHDYSCLLGGLDPVSRDFC